MISGAMGSPVWERFVLLGHAVFSVVETDDDRVHGLCLIPHRPWRVGTDNAAPYCRTRGGPGVTIKPQAVATAWGFERGPRGAPDRI